MPICFCCFDPAEQGVWELENLTLSLHGNIYEVFVEGIIIK